MADLTAAVARAALLLGALQRISKNSKRHHSTNLLGDMAVLPTVVALLGAAEAGTATTEAAGSTSSRGALAGDVADATATLSSSVLIDETPGRLT